MVVRLRCSAIGPSSAWSAVATSPSVPCVGSCVLPVAGGVDGEAPGTGEPLGAGEPLAVALGLGAGEPLAAGDPLAAGVPLAPGEPLGVAVGGSDGTTSRKSAGRSVLISMNPDPVVRAVAWRPCFANTASTWSGVTFGSSNRISHLVPPV